MVKKAATEEIFLEHKTKVSTLVNLFLINRCLPHDDVQ
jgi:hypothetical protein